MNDNERMIRAFARELWKKTEVICPECGKRIYVKEQIGSIYNAPKCEYQCACGFSDSKREILDKEVVL